MSFSAKQEEGGFYGTRLRLQAPESRDDISAFDCCVHALLLTCNDSLLPLPWGRCISTGATARWSVSLRAKLSSARILVRRADFRRGLECRNRAPHQVKRVLNAYAIGGR
jgi:hypothetical protein